LSHGAAANQIAGALPAGGQLLVLIRLRASDHCALIGCERDRAIGMTGIRLRLFAASGPWCDIDPALSNVRILPRSASWIGTLARWSDWPGGPDQRRHCIGE
jgi:hypothetical protein